MGEWLKRGDGGVAEEGVGGLKRGWGEWLKRGMGE